MRHLWRWFCGYVCIILKGRQINRFLNLCSRNGISLWKISHNIGHGIHAHVCLKDFYHLKPFLRKTKTKLRIIRRKGFPFWCHRHPRLKWLFVILFFILCLTVYSSTYVWNIEISGNSKVSTLELEQFLLEQNISTGKKRSSIDCSYIELLLRQSFEQIGWVSVYLENTSLCIEIKESLYEEYDKNQTDVGRQYDLVANKDAVIYSIVTRAGNAMVKAGSVVKAGDVLVLGYFNVYDDAGEIKSVQKVTAEALIYGDVTYTYCETINEMEILSLKISGLYSEEMLLQIANQKMNHFIEKLESNGVIILDKNVMINKDENNIVLGINVYAREQIGINIPVEEVTEYEFE